MAERGTTNKPAKEDNHRNEGKKKKSDPMLKENAGTQNEGRRDTKANVEAVDKNRIEDEKGDQDQRRK